MEQWVTDYWNHYGAIGLFPVWFALTAVINLVTRVSTPQGIVTAGDKIPAVHAILTLIRGWGIDPIALLEAAEVYAQKKAEQEVLKASESPEDLEK